VTPKKLKFEPNPSIAKAFAHGLVASTTCACTSRPIQTTVAARLAEMMLQVASIQVGERNSRYHYQEQRARQGCFTRPNSYMCVAT
jgi:hypothetical protein